MNDTGGAAHATGNRAGRSGGAAGPARTLRPLWVLLALLPPVLCFVLSSVFLSRWERGIDAANQFDRRERGPGRHLPLDRAGGARRHRAMGQGGPAGVARREQGEDRRRQGRSGARRRRVQADGGLPGRARGLRAGAGGSRALLRRGRQPARRRGGRHAEGRGGARPPRCDRRRARQVHDSAHRAQRGPSSSARTPSPPGSGAAPRGSPTPATRWPSPSSSPARCWASAPRAARPRSPRSAAASTSSASTISTPSPAASPTISGTCSAWS